MGKIKVLGICASPRKGNSLFLLNKSLEAITEKYGENVETSTYTLRGKKFSPCVDCGGCAKGTCILKDDFNELHQLWMEADVILYSVPVYHFGMPGQLKCFFDRLGNTMAGRYASLYEPGQETFPKLLKVAGNIVHGDHMCSGQETTLMSLVAHEVLMQSIPVTGDMWQSYLGSGGWTQNHPFTSALSEQFERGDFTASTMVKSAQDVGLRCYEMAVIVKNGLANTKEEFMTESPTYQVAQERCR